MINFFYGGIIMNKSIYIATALFLLIPICGCLNAIPEMSDEDESKIVRYMADSVIRNDVSYEPRLLDEDAKAKALEEEMAKAELLKEIKDKEEISKQETKENNTAANVEVVEEPNVYTMADINDYLGVEGIEFEFVDYELYNSYPLNTDELGFVVSPAENNVLLVLKLNIYNVSGSDLDVDLFNKAVYKVLINSDKKITSIKTLFEDDLNTFNFNIKNETGKNAVLIFEIPKDLTIEKLAISVSNNVDKPIYIDVN